jgi:hypothetical protein
LIEGDRAMIKDKVTQLYGYTSQLMLMLEDEIDILQSTGESAIDAKRNITETLNKLVTMILQLNKLSKEESGDDIDTISSNDQAIIDRFLEKYK